MRPINPYPLALLNHFTVPFKRRPDWDQRQFSGRYDYRVVRDASSFKIKFKKATVINCDAMHFPISIPF